MKQFIYLLAACYVAFMTACGGNATKTAAETAHLHDHGEEVTRHDNHEEHDHSEHDHEQEGHDHAAEASHGHDEHDHSEHNHEQEGHDHAAETPHGHDGHDHEESASARPNEIVFPAAQAARIDFAVAAVEPVEFREVIRCSGEIDPAQNDVTGVAAPVSGVVGFSETPLSIGTRVAKDQILFYISSKEMAGGDVIAKTEAEYEAAKAEYERAKTLLSDRIISQKEYETIRQNYLTAQSEWEALAAGRTEKGSAVRSPLSGYVTALNIAPGDFVEAGTALATVSKDRRQRLTARISERYYPRLADIRSANFVTASGTLVELEKQNGKILSVGRSHDGSSTLIPVTFEFDSHPGVVPGSLVEVYLLGRARQGVIALPETAIAEAQGVYYVYVQLDEECYERREVKIGASDGKQVEILSGIQPGERVVTRGAVHVKMATSSAIPHSHSH